MMMTPLLLWWARLHICGPRYTRIPVFNWLLCILIAQQVGGRTSCESQSLKKCSSDAIEVTVVCRDDIVNSVFVEIKPKPKLFWFRF